MHKATSKKLAFKLLAATASLGVTSALVMVNAPSVRAAQVGGVQGTVKDANGLPLKGAQVLLIPTGGGAPQPARTDSSGYYSFAGIQPGTYTLEVNVVTFVSGNQNVSVTQDTNSTIDFALAKKEVGRVGTGGRIAPTKRTDTLTETNISARDERQEKSQPNQLYQSTGLVNLKPGVTTDAGQYPHIRGSDQNQVNYSVDGIDVRDPIFNQFATNLVTVGIRTSNLVTGGASADYGGALGGYLNQITVNGRDISHGKAVGGFIEQTNGPAHDWQYTGAATQIGGVLLNNKLDYALSSIVFRTHYAGNTQITNLASSHDESAKFNYYASPNDTFTGYFSHGAENYNFPGSPNSLFFDPDKPLIDPATGRQYYSVRDLGSTFSDHSVQTHNLDHFTYKHNFASSSFLQYRIFQLHQATPGHYEGGNQWNFARTNITGNQLDYFNQISKRNIVKAGLQYLDNKGSFFRQIVNVQTGPLVAGKSYSDRIYASYPKDFQLYLSDELRSADNRFTFNYGLRYNSVSYKVQDSQYLDSIGQSNPSSFTTSSTDPRLGLNFSPSPDLTFRTSYSVNSQRPDMRRIQRVSPLDVGAIGTTLSTNPLSQSKAASGVLPLSRVGLSHSKDFDLGVEKAFDLKGLVQGSYNINVTGFRKFQYDLIYENPANYDVNAGPTTPLLYGNQGQGRADGIEVSLRKERRKPSDWNGYINYTSQVVRANSDSTLGYIPYFTAYLGGNPLFVDSANGPVPAGKFDLRSLNHRLFATAWDQHHTVGVVVNKRVSKLISTSIILDAGSGLPFFGGATNDGTLGGSIGSGFANIHTTAGGTAEFTQVPITLDSNGKLPPINPVVGYTGWHYKIGINTDFNLTPDFSLFLNVDNVFDKKTPLALSTGTFAGTPYYVSPSAEFPQGRQIFGSQALLTPVFVTFGFRQNF